jgi:2-C-methyl-D-erythritol 4-phosphate cytidylyltransferase
MSVTAVIVAGGSGTRLGMDIPKAFVPLGTKPLLCHSYAVFAVCEDIEEIIVVVPQSHIAETRKILSDQEIRKTHRVISGGSQRWISVRNGVCGAQTELVLIHDAARPFVTTDILHRLCKNLRDYAGVITATPVVDTVRYFEKGLCGTTLDRSRLIAVGTPQLFRRSILVSCYDNIDSLPSIPTDEAMLLEQNDIPVAWAEGDPLNFKITTPADYTMAQCIIREGYDN